MGLRLDSVMQVRISRRTKFFMCILSVFQYFLRIDLIHKESGFQPGTCRCSKNTLDKTRLEISEFC